MEKLFRQHLIIATSWSLVLLVAFSLSLSVFSFWYGEENSNTAQSSNRGNCNIAVMSILGDIVPYSEKSETDEEVTPSVSSDDVASFLREVGENEAIKGMLVQIDSYGGSMASSSIITNQLRKLSIPTASYIREMGTSGGYLIASGTQTIIASPYSDVGGLGVTMSYLENVKKNEKEGLEFLSLVSAPYKDYFNANKPLTSEERKFVERDLKIYHEQLVKDIAENRKLTLDEVRLLADGTSMPGTLALEKKLIDQLGDKETAREWFAEKLNLPKEEIIYCE